MQFLQDLRGGYAAKIRAISTIDEMQVELDAADDVELLVLAGHGTPTSLTFGESKPKYGIHLPKEKTELNIETKEIQRMLQKLSKDAVIFLDSCLNGYGGKKKKNIANVVAKAAPGRTVIASVETFNAKGITINREYPLDLSIVAAYTHRACTYVTRHVQK